eukprot:scaffold26584_cov73-Phaeocystis_antarctica.AAC.1
MRLPKSRPSGVRTDSQSLSSIGKPHLGEGENQLEPVEADQIVDQQTADFSGTTVQLWRLTWPEAQGAARRSPAVPACLKPGQAGVACGARQDAAERERRRSPEARRAA